MPTSRLLNKMEKARLKELRQHPILRKYAKRIVDLEFKSNTTPKDERELELLCDPSTARYAKTIANLQFKMKRSAVESRFLQLLLLPNMRDYAQEIAQKLEPNIVDESSGLIEPSVEKQLSLYYFFQMHKVPLAFHNFKHTVHLSHCGTISDRKNWNASTKKLERSLFYGTVMNRYQSAFAMLQKRIHEGSNEVVYYYLKKMKANPQLLSAPSAQHYINTKTTLLALSIKRYLALKNSQKINDDYITGLFETLKTAIKYRVFSLRGNSLYPISKVDRTINSPVSSQSFFAPQEEAKWKLFRESAAKLSKYRVTPQLIHQNWPGEWLPIHSELLEFLVAELPLEDRLSPKKALKEMSNLSEEKAEALKILYTHGLRGHDLRSYPGEFALETKNALIHLVKLQDMSIDEAIDKLKTLSFSDMDELGAAWILKSPPRI